MTSRLRPTVAALLLLLPGASVLMAPAAAQQRAVAAPTIQSIALNADRGLAPGSTLQVNVQASPRAERVEVQLGDSGVEIPLQEVAPGAYRGRYTVRIADRIDPTDRLVVNLNTGTQTIARNFTYPPSFQVARVERPRELPRDQRFPTITDLTPANGDRLGERGRVHIAATLGDDGSGVDPASVRLRVDGQDVTSQARVTEGEVQFRENLQPGRHSVEVRVKDRAGNMTSKTWGFDVVERERDRDRDRDRVGERGRDRDGDRDRVGGGPLPLRVTSPDNGASIDARGNLLVEGRTAPGAAVRVQIEAVSAVGGVLGLTQQVMDHTVQADREGRFSVSGRPATLPLPGTRFEVRLTVNSGGQTAEERITLHQRQG